VSEILLIT